MSDERQGDQPLATRIALNWLHMGYRSYMAYGDIDVVADYGADPTWQTYSDTAFANAIADASPGQTVGVPPGQYKVMAPIIVKPYAGLAGAPGTPLVASWAEYGSVIKPGPDWAQSGAPLNAVVLMLGQAAGGYSTASEEQHFSHLMISGSALPAGQVVHGLGSVDQVKRVQLREVHIARMTGDGIHQEYPQVQPDGWTAFHVFSRYSAGNGYTLRSADSNWTKCLATNSGVDGWSLNTTGNSQYNGCRSEWSGRNGYRYVCTNNRYAAGGTTYAGLAMRSYPGTVVVAGCVVFPGVNDDGSGVIGPYGGLKISATRQALLSGCYIQGYNRAWTVASSPRSYPACAWATGPANAPVTVPGP